MTPSDVLTLWFLQLAARVPEILACLGLCVWVLVCWRQVPASRVWALLGFGLLLALTLLSPGLTVATRYWIVEDALPAKRVGVLSMIYALVWSTFHLLAYVLLAAAIYTGRSAPTAAVLTPTVPPPLPRPPNLPPA